MKFYFLHFGWNDPDVEFSGSPKKTVTSSAIIRSHSTAVSGDNVWVHSCIFELTDTYTDSGGAIFYTTDGSFLLVE